MKKRNALALVLGMSVSAFAGQKLTAPVVIQNPQTGNAYAYGALGAAHDTVDNIQYIGCDVTGYSGSRAVTCSAKDSAGNYVACYSSDPSKIDVASNLAPNSWIYFAVEYDNPTMCLQIRVITSSKYQ
jgi:hypothetical protein